MIAAARVATRQRTRSPTQGDVGICSRLRSPEDNAAAPAIGDRWPWLHVKIAEVDRSAPRSVVNLDALTAVGERAAIGEDTGHRQPGPVNGGKGDQVTYDQHPGARSKGGHRTPGEIELHPGTEPHVGEVKGSHLADVDQLDELGRLHHRVIHDLGNREIELHIAGERGQHGPGNLASGVVNEHKSLSEVREVTGVVAEHDPGFAPRGTGGAPAEGDHVGAQENLATLGVGTGSRNHSTRREGEGNAAIDSPTTEIDCIIVGIGDLYVFVVLITAGGVEVDHSKFNHCI
ncbi:MAG: hypothetical protein CMN05_10885 [Roseibacillus sp.]|nr:hypothetical protein [Roseibacillus sp.]